MGAVGRCHDEKINLLVHKCWLLYVFKHIIDFTQRQTDRGFSMRVSGEQLCSTLTVTPVIFFSKQVFTI